VPCPKPTKNSEKWRYEIINDCLKAINQPLVNSDKLKQSHEQCLNDAVEDVSQELTRVASMGDSDEQRMMDFVRKAAKLWLEVGQQPYRIFLLMSKIGTTPSRSGQAFVDAHGEQELVVGPEVRRMGNMQGERLEKDELVPDCEGTFSVLSVEKIY
jgi:hypothetical protein